MTKSVISVRKYCFVQRTVLCELKAKSVKSISLLGTSLPSHESLILATTDTTGMRCGNLPSIIEDTSLIARRLLHI